MRELPLRIKLGVSSAQREGAFGVTRQGLSSSRQQREFTRRGYAWVLQLPRRRAGDTTLAVSSDAVFGGLTHRDVSSRRGSGRTVS